MLTFSAISKSFRPRIISRGLSSLRSSGGAGPRGRFGRRATPVGIPDNATKASNALLRPDPIPDAARESSYNSLYTPVLIPEDPGAVITERHPAARLLENSALVVQRQLELGNLLIGFEQANKYTISDPAGNHVGFIAEEEHSITKMLMRQWARTHRPFTTHIFDKHGVEVLRFHRPFSFINSRITAYDPLDPSSTPGNVSHVTPDQYRVIGECQQEWHLLRRKYNLFLYQDNALDATEKGYQPEAGGRDGVYKQFAYVDEPVLSWDFSLLTGDEPPKLIGSVNRNFAGFGREIFTDTGVYALRMDAASVAAEPSHLTHQQYDYRNSTPESPESERELQNVGEAAAGRGMTLDERAVMLATAVSIDFDYFSRHSSVGHSGIMPVGVFGGGYHEPTQPAPGGAADAGMAGMMGEAMGGAMGGRYSGEQQQAPPEQQQQRPQSEPEYVPSPYGEPMQTPYGDHPPPENPWQYVGGQQQPFFPPQEQQSEDSGGGGFWFFDEEE
ncbi:Scramblase-domain-containing protein [Sphaerosporella brunnea]|uniref:Scramblase-domain-containing protein n=1 Tax=Sphaerosporella brunnea TaxID=1250544 RepID=A0A5J5F6H9_9PEZI|nr:Scramblase-domain-containing protein [Sphaerosporella brunnea]